MIRDRFGEMVGGDWHWPRYTKGCWGDHKHKKCISCKFRYPIRLITLALRIRKR